MTKWTIYDREGNVLHESLTEYNSDGKIVYQDTFEYSGKWMGERFLTVSVKSAYPIDFQIGDYIDYRGERFTINYDPTVIKKARRGTYGEGFTYDSIKFNSYSNELTQMRFHDWVLSDNTLHYTSLPNFSFYAKDVDDLVDRLQACADRWCKDNKRSKEEYWMFYTLRNNTTTGTSDTGQTQTYYERTTQRANDILESCGIALDGTEGTNFLTSVQAEWEKMYGSGDSYTDSRDDERYDRSITVSNQTVWEGMAMIKQQFGLNFIIRGRNVYVGTAGIPTNHIFTYGKGNGLYEIDRTADQDQLVVTRLHAYGSDENLPTRYYADLNAQPYCLVSKIISQDATSDKPGVQFVTDLLWDDKYFNNFITEAWNSAYRVVVSCGSVSSVGFAWQYTDGDTTKVAVTVRYAGTTANSQLLSYDKDTVSQFVATVAVNAQVTFQAGANTSVFPSDRKTYVTENLPDNMAVNFLMLPGFPNNSLADLCKAEYDSTKDVTNYYIRKDTSSDYVLFHTESGNHVVVFSEDQYDPYIVSPNADTLGIKDGDISCTEENDDNGLEKVYPTIEEMTVSEAGIGSGDTRVDAVVAADAIDDNGVYPKGTTQEENIKGFHIYLPALGFDLRQAAKDAGGSEMQIIMQDGFCGARTFTVSNCSQLSSSSSIKQTYSNAVWDLSCKRTYDSSLDLYFPYSYAKSVSKTDEELKAAGMSNAYQIVAGDHYVLTGISVSDVNYVYAASVRLLRKAIHWLLKNDYTRYVYNPKIDEIYMAREAVIAKSLGNTSLHDALVEGDIMLFKDDDLRIDGSVYIDQLTIKENGNNGIPTYEVTLRNEVTVGTIQRLQNQVDSIKNDVKTGNVGGGLTNPTQVAALIQAYGNNWFLSKTSPDTASGKITFADGLASNNVAELLKGLTVGDGKYGITEEGVATLASILSQKWNISEEGIATLAGIVADYLKSSDFKEGYLDGKGFGLYKDDQGNSVLQVAKLFVTMKAVFAELEIRKLSYVGGDQVHSFAGSTLQMVIPVDSTGKEVTDGTTPNAYKCYYLDDDGTTRTQNWWKVGDQARCQTFDIAEGVYNDVSNKYYWRLVVETGEEDVAVGTDSDGNTVVKHMGYVTLSNQSGGFTLKDPDDGTKNIQVNGSDITFIGYDSSTTNDTPAADDKIVQLGSQCDPDRGYAYIIYVTEQRRVDYAGISDYNLSDHAVAQYSPKGSFVYSSYFQFRDGNPTSWHPMVNYRGAYDSTLSYAYYDEVDYDGSLWLHIGTADTTGVTPGTDSTVWQIVVAGYNDSAEVEMVILSDDGDGFLDWGDEATYTCRVRKGTRDLTSQVASWSVERDTGDSVNDAAWKDKDKAKNFAGTITIVTGETDDDIGTADTDKATFTFYAFDSANATMAKARLVFK